MNEVIKVGRSKMQMMLIVETLMHTQLAVHQQYTAHCTDCTIQGWMCAPEYQIIILYKIICLLHNHNEYRLVQHLLKAPAAVSCSRI